MVVLMCYLQMLLAAPPAPHSTVLALLIFVPYWPCLALPWLDSCYVFTSQLFLQCTLCAYSYSLDSKTGACFECKVEGCKDCSAPGVCRACSSGMGLDKSGKCVEVSL